MHPTHLETHARAIIIERQRVAADRRRVRAARRPGAEQVAGGPFAPRHRAPAEPIPVSLGLRVEDVRRREVVDAGDLGHTDAGRSDDRVPACCT